MTPTKQVKDKPFQFYSPKLANESGNSLKPMRIGAIPKLAVLLGLLSPLYYEIYNLCDGEKTVEEIATQLKSDTLQTRMNVDKLVKSRMIELN
jgi:hypothetical protein